MSMVYTTQAHAWAVVTDMDLKKRCIQIHILIIILIVQAAGKACERRADRALEENCKDSRGAERSSQQGMFFLEVQQ